MKIALLYYNKLELPIFMFLIISPREGTPAALMPQLDRTVIKQRVAEMRSLAKLTDACPFPAPKGSVDMMLVEGDGKGILSSFESVQLDAAEQYHAGDLVPVHITDIADEKDIVTPLQNKSG